MHPKRTILCARLMLSMAAFNYLAFLLISYPALGIILQSHLALQTSMQGQWKPHFLLWPSMGSNELQSALSSHGSAAQNSLLRFLIVQASRRPGHRGDKKDTFESSLGKKIFVQSECPHKCDLTLHSWKPGKMKTWRPSRTWWGPGQVNGRLRTCAVLNWRMLRYPPSWEYPTHSYTSFPTSGWH